jgi:hypothetical protein
MFMLGLCVPKLKTTPPPSCSAAGVTKNYWRDALSLRKQLGLKRCFTVFYGNFPPFNIFARTIRRHTLLFDSPIGHDT